MSNRIGSKLFSELGISDYQVEHRFIAPRGNPPREGICPDLIVAFKNHLFNLLIIEAIARMNREGSIKLEHQIDYLRHFVQPPGQDCLYYLLEERISRETIKSCGIITAGVYSTKQGGFRIYRTERLR